jgi:ATP-binding cassette, subfamily B, bacterial
MPLSPEPGWAIPESSLTEAAQFTELLMTPPAVVDPIVPEPLRPTASDVRFGRVTFAHAGAPPLFTGLDLAVPSGTRLGLVGRSGGGKSTLARLLLPMMDIDEGRILIGGQDITKLRQTGSWRRARTPNCSVSTERDVGVPGSF